MIAHLSDNLYAQTRDEGSIELVPHFAGVEDYVLYLTFTEQNKLLAFIAASRRTDD